MRLRSKFYTFPKKKYFLRLEKQIKKILFLYLNLRYSLHMAIEIRIIRYYILMYIAKEISL